MTKTDERRDGGTRKREREYSIKSLVDESPLTDSRKYGRSKEMSFSFPSPLNSCWISFQFRCGEREMFFSVTLSSLLRLKTGLSKKMTRGTKKSFDEISCACPNQQACPKRCTEKQRTIWGENASEGRIHRFNICSTLRLAPNKA